MISQVSNALAFAFLPLASVYSERSSCFHSLDYRAFAVLQSASTRSGHASLSSSLKDDLRYTPSDCFETFPFPKTAETNDSRSSTRQGLLRVPRRPHGPQQRGPDQDLQPLPRPAETSPDILRLRELHAAMDRAVLDAYGWTDLKPTASSCSTTKTRKTTRDGAPAQSGEKKPWRYRWPDDVRDEVLARLLALNQERAHRKPLPARRPKPRPSRPPENARHERARPATTTVPCSNDENRQLSVVTRFGDDS